MTQYIDKSALVAEIERLRKNRMLDDRHDQGVLDGIYAIERFINTLEVKEVDLDFTKEVDMWIENNGDTNGFFNVQDLAKHFFELGLKAQKA